MFVGDVFHHPLQIYHPDWNSSLCEQPDVARRTRTPHSRVLRRMGSLLAPAHFRRPYCGRVLRSDAGFTFVPSEVST